MGRRRDNDIEGLIGPIAVLLFFFGAAVLAFLKALALVALICGGIALIGFVLFRVGQNFWSRQLDIEAYLPWIDWSLPAVSAIDSTWLKIRFPEFSGLSAAPNPNVVGMSGAWKSVVSKLERFPGLRSATGPRELQQRVAACETAAPNILQQCLAEASELARQKESELNQQVKSCRELEKELENRVRPKLNTLRDTIEAMASSGFFDRLRAKRLAVRLSEFEIQLRNRCREARDRADRQEHAVRRFLDPAQRGIAAQDRIKQELVAMKEVVTSKSSPHTRMAVQ